MAAAAAVGLERTIYLGGLAEAKHGHLSKHLQSRIEVAGILQSGPVPKSIALPLTEGLTSEALCQENRIREIIPRQLMTCREAMAKSIHKPITAGPQRFTQKIYTSCALPPRYNH